MMAMIGMVAMTMIAMMTMMAVVMKLTDSVDAGEGEREIDG